MRQPYLENGSIEDVWHQWKTEVKIAGKRTNHPIWKTKGNGSKNELFIHLNMNAAFANALAAINIFVHTCGCWL